MASTIPEKNRSRPFRETLAPWLWLFPALAIMLLFLVYPALNTVWMSFRTEKKIDEKKLKQEIILGLGLPDVESGMKQRVRNIPGWKNSLKPVKKKYRIQNLESAVTPEMTVRELEESLVSDMLAASGGGKISSVFCGLDNFTRMFRDSSMLTAFRNNIFWLLLFTSLSVGLGLGLAALSERVKWSVLSRTVIFFPMCISFVAAAVIWAFMYEKDPSQGTVNAILKLVAGRNFTGIAFLGRTYTVNPALIIAGVWMWTGYCMVIFSAALRSIPHDVIEAARLESATPFQIFRLIEVPMIRPTITVVTTVMIITVLKVFDIVYVMTGGGPYGSSEVLANRMYRTAFNEGDPGYAAAMAVILFAAVLPVMIGNIRSFIIEESEKE